MNARLARKRALWKGLGHPEPILTRGLYEKTGSLGMAYGLFKPRLYIDPRLLGEHRVLKVFVLNHEGAHLALGHTRILAVAKILGILFVAALLGVVAALTTRVPWIAYVSMFVGAWCEARLGLFTLWLRAACEREADSVALSTMLPSHFATAIKTMWKIQPTKRGYDAWAERVIYGDTWVERLNRCGLAPAGD